MSPRRRAPGQAVSLPEVLQEQPSNAGSSMKIGRKMPEKSAGIWQKNLCSCYTDYSAAQEEKTNARAFGNHSQHPRKNSPPG